MRSPKFAIEVENSITSSIYLCVLRPTKFAIEADNYITTSLYLYVLRTTKYAIEGENSIKSSIYSMRPPKFAMETAGNAITSSIYLCDLLSLQSK